MYFVEPAVKNCPEIVESKDCALFPEKRITVQGFVHRVRSLGGANFMVIRDGVGEIQVFADRETAGFPGIKEGYIVKVKGICRREARAPSGIEIVAERIETIVAPPEEMPLTINKNALNLHLDMDINNREITLRHLRYRHLFKIQEGLARGFREFLTGQNFTEVFTPKIVGTGTEGGANVFSLDYFGKPAFLAQSPQLYKQTMVGVFGKVFEVGPVFRAEPHDTARHLNEYISLDLEMGFIDSFTDIMALETACLQSMFCLLQSHYGKDLEALGIACPDAGKIPVLHVKEAHELVREKTGEDFRNLGELAAREEAIVGKIVQEKYGSEMVFVTHYSSGVRPFYAMEAEDNPQETLTFDLLYKGMEITTGGQRIHDYRQLVSKMLSRGMNLEDQAHYLAIFKYGMPPHGGLGMGLERLTALLAGYENVRYGSLFPRDMLRLTP